MTGKTDSRRKVLKSIAVGAIAVVAGQSLPEAWSKPVVDAVLLPAHAETTDDSGSSGGGVTTTTTTTTTAAPVPDTYFGLKVPIIQLVTENGAAAQGKEMLASAVDALIPQAHARISSDIDISVEIMGSSAQVRFTNGQRDAIFSASVPTNGSASGIPALEAGGCVPTQGPQSVQLNGYTPGANRVTVQVNGGRGNSWRVEVDEGPIGSLTASCLISDRRLKTNIEFLSTTGKGLDLYTFQYRDDVQQETYVGVMAQDVMQRRPDAVNLNDSGYYSVRYDLLGLKMVTQEQWEKEGPGSVKRVDC